MELILFFWSIMIIIIGIQVYKIVSYVIKGERIKIDDTYSDEAIQKTRIIVEALRTKRIKKHIITNSAPKYDSKKALKQYKNFLSSELMKELSFIKEERYNG